jgi:rubrerythrin
MLSQKFYLNKSFDVSKIQWDSYQPDKLTELQSEVIKMNTVIEYASLPAALSMFREIPEDLDLRSFIAKWVHDEHKHAFVLKEYSSKYIPNHEATLHDFEEVAIPFSDSPMTIAEMMALHMCTELSVIRWYRKMADYHTEPLIKNIYKNLVLDEANHAGAFKQFMKKYHTKENEKGILAIFQLFMTKRFFISIKAASTLDIDKKSVHSRLPNPELFDHFLNNILQFSEKDQAKLQNSILRIASNLVGKELNTLNELKAYRKSL